MRRAGPHSQVLNAAGGVQGLGDFGAARLPGTMANFNPVLTWSEQRRAVELFHQAHVVVVRILGHARWRGQQFRWKRTRHMQ